MFGSKHGNVRAMRAVRASAVCGCAIISGVRQCVAVCGSARRSKYVVLLQRI